MVSLQHRWFGENEKWCRMDEDFVCGEIEIMKMLPLVDDLRVKGTDNRVVWLTI